MNYNNRTDLAIESIKDTDNLRGKGVTTKVIHDEIDIILTQIITKEAESSLGRRRGEYYSLCVGEAWHYETDFKRKIAHSLAKTLKKLANITGGKFTNLLVCGLGNKEITVDSLGTLVIESLSKKIKNEPISLLLPGVKGITGISSFNMVHALIRELSPSLVIVIDSLISRELWRLGTLIQLTDTGITPGSGVSKHSRELSFSTLGIPVIAIGVPTVALVDKNVIDSELRVTPACIDSVLDALAEIIANGILDSFL